MARVETPSWRSAVERGAPAPAQTSRKKGAECACTASLNARTDSEPGTLGGKGTGAGSASACVQSGLRKTV